MYVHPGTHTTGSTSGGANAPPYGVRFRLRADYPVTSLSAGAQVVAKAMQKYGLFLADGGNIALTAASDQFTTHKWTDVGVTSQSLTAIQVSDMEVVDMGTPIAASDCVRATPEAGPGDAWKQILLASVAAGVRTLGLAFLFAAVSAGCSSCTAPGPASRHRPGAAAPDRRRSPASLLCAAGRATGSTSYEAFAKSLPRGVRAQGRRGAEHGGHGGRRAQHPFCHALVDPHNGSWPRSTPSCARASS